jgi:enoyl-CoA hydratase/carnithine racemase
MTHIDVRLLSEKTPAPGVNSTEILDIYGKTAQLFASLPVIFIAEISGLATGAGTELAVQMDMVSSVSFLLDLDVINIICHQRFAGPGTKIGFLDGLLPGNGGLQYLIKLAGIDRAAEYVLSAGDADAETAAQIGWVNTAYPSKEELHLEVEKLAHRIATFPETALSTAKASITANRPSKSSVDGDTARFKALLGGVAQKAIDRFLVLTKNQTSRNFELGLNEDLVEVWA